MNDNVENKEPVSPPEPQADMQKMVDEAVNRTTQALKEHNYNLVGENKKLKERLSQFDGINPDEMKGILRKFQEDEDLKLLAEGKTSEYMQRQHDKFRADFDQKEQALLSRNQQLEQERDQIRKQYQDSTKARLIRQAGAKAGIPGYAMDDLELRGNQVIHLNENMEPEVRINGVLQVDPATGGPLSLDAWVGSLRQNAPHLFGASQGAGLAGGTNGLSMTDSIQRAAVAGNTEEFRRLRREQLNKTGKGPRFK